MLQGIVTELSTLLRFLREYDSTAAFMFSAIALDPRFNSSGRLIQFVCGSDKMRAVSEEYESKFLIPMLARARGIVVPDPPQAQDIMQDESSGIFGEIECDDGPLDQIRWELRHFRKENTHWVSEPIRWTAKRS